jgi:uncharacterized protein
MPNAFAHIELNTPNVAKSRAFYAKLFKWKIAPYPEMPTYMGIDTGSKETGGGISQKEMPEAPTAWLPYVEVASVKKSLAKAKKLGARIVVDYQSLGEIGAIGIFVDPAGAGLGVWEPGKPAKKRKPKRS